MQPAIICYLDRMLQGRVKECKYLSQLWFQLEPHVSLSHNLTNIYDSDFEKKMYLDLSIAIYWDFR